jgi:VIT1/CCC1 family predicted Fe2+/Mn2+ transporter
MNPAIGQKTIKRLLGFQKNEITEYHIYNRLSQKIKGEKNKKVLRQIATDELRHYNFYKDYTGKDVKPSKRKIFKFYWIARIFGLTFGLKLMEKGEERAKNVYEEVATELPEVKNISEEEDEHEQELLNLIEEERLNYISSIVLGLNDALVELTGTLAGLTFALQNTRLTALAGLITGIAASFSMGASEYLSNKTEGNNSQEAFKSALYTWTAYLITVIALILPYLLLSNYFLCLILTLAVGIIIILVFNFYISVAKDLSFRKRFLEMSAISLGVAALSFGIGYFIRIFLGVDV